MRLSDNTGHSFPGNKLNTELQRKCDWNLIQEKKCLVISAKSLKQVGRERELFGCGKCVPKLQKSSQNGKGTRNERNLENFALPGFVNFPQFSSQMLSYVTPSFPQTGRKFRTQEQFCETPAIVFEFTLWIANLCKTSQFSKSGSNYKARLDCFEKPKKITFHIEHGPFFASPLNEPNH